MLLPSPYQQCNFISALLMGHTVCDLIEYNAGTCQHQENWTYVLLCWGDPGQALRPAQHPLAVSPQCDGGENEKRKSKTTGGQRSSRLLSEGKRKVKGQSLPWCSASLWSAPTGQTSDFIAEQDALRMGIPLLSVPSVLAVTPPNVLPTLSMPPGEHSDKHDLEAVPAPFSSS